MKLFKPTNELVTVFTIYFKERLILVFKRCVCFLHTCSLFPINPFKYTLLMPQKPTVLTESAFQDGEMILCNWQLWKLSLCAVVLRRDVLGIWLLWKYIYIYIYIYIKKHMSVCLFLSLRLPGNCVYCLQFIFNRNCENRFISMQSKGKYTPRT